MAQSTNVSSGPALIVIYESDRCNGEDLAVDRTGTTTTDVILPSIILDRVDQLNDAALSVQRDQFPHQTQLSSKPVKYLQIGAEPTLDLSIAAITFENIVEALGVNSLQDYTAATPGDIGAATEDRFDVVDNAGSSIEGKCIQLIPYPLLPGYSQANGVDPFSDANITAYGTAGVSAADQKSYLEGVITIPNAKIVDINQINLVYGLQTQREIQLQILGAPDNNGERLFFGDYAA